MNGEIPAKLYLNEEEKEVQASKTKTLSQFYDTNSDTTQRTPLLTKEPVRAIDDQQISREESKLRINGTNQRVAERFQQANLRHKKSKSNSPAKKHKQQFFDKKNFGQKRSPHNQHLQPVKKISNADNWQEFFQLQKEGWKKITASISKGSRLPKHFK